MRSILLAGAAWAALSVAHAEDWRAIYQRGYDAAPPVAALDFGAPIGDRPVVVLAPNVVPISIIDGRAHVLVFFGGYPIEQSMVIDTGASIMSVTDSLARKLVARGDAVFAPSLEIAMADGRSEMKARIVIHLLSLGGRMVRETEAIVNPDGIEMLLPFGVLAAGGRFTIDPRAGFISFGAD